MRLKFMMTPKQVVELRSKLKRTDSPNRNSILMAENITDPGDLKPSNPKSYFKQQSFQPQKDKYNNKQTLLSDHSLYNSSDRHSARFQRNFDFQAGLPKDGVIINRTVSTAGQTQRIKLGQNTVHSRYGKHRNGQGGSMLNTLQGVPHTSHGTREAQASFKRTFSNTMPRGSRFSKES